MIPPLCCEARHLGLSPKVVLAECQHRI